MTVYLMDDMYIEYQTMKRIQLNFLKNCNIVIYDLERPESTLNKRVDQNGMIDLRIHQHPDYRFLKYEVVDIN